MKDTKQATEPMEDIDLFELQAATSSAANIEEWRLLVAFPI
jgi:hypothetical protein